MAASTHEIRQRPPLRALGLSALLSLVGLVLLLMATLVGANLLLTVAGLVVVVLGLALFVVAVWTAATQRARVELDDAGYAIRDEQMVHVGTWSEVARVTRGRDRITLHRRDGSRMRLLIPRGARADLDALGADIARRLDADRGYRA